MAMTLLMPPLLYDSATSVTSHPSKHHTYRHIPVINLWHNASIMPDDMRSLTQDDTSHGLTGFRGLIARSVSNPSNLVGYGGNKAVFQVEGQDDLLVGVSYYGTIQGRPRFEHMLKNHERRELAPPKCVKPVEAFFDALKYTTHLTPPKHLYTAHGFGQVIANFTREGFQDNGLMLIRKEAGETLLEIENGKVADKMEISEEEALERYRARMEEEYRVDRTTRTEIREQLDPDMASQEVNALLATATKAALIKHYEEKRAARPNDPEIDVRREARTHIVEHMFMPNLEQIYDELVTYCWTMTPDATDLKPDNILWDEETGKINFIDQGAPRPGSEIGQRKRAVEECLASLERMFDEYCFDIDPKLREAFEAKRTERREHYLNKMTEPFANLEMRGSTETLSSHEDVRSQALDDGAGDPMKSQQVLSAPRKWLDAISSGIEERAADGPSR